MQENTIYLAVATALILPTAHHLMRIVQRQLILRKIPLFRDGQWSARGANARLAADPIGFLQRGLGDHPQGFRIDGDQGCLIIVPPECGDVINSNENFTSLEPLQEFLRFDLSGGEGLYEIHNANHDLFVKMLRTKLTQNDGQLNEELMHEGTSALDSTWGMSREWREVEIRSSVLRIVSRMSTRIFLGKELCSDEVWLQIVSEYVIKIFECARTLRPFPNVLASIYHAFSKTGRDVRSQVKQARRLLQPYIDDVLGKFEDSEDEMGKKPFSAVVWLEEAAKGKKYDPVAMQLGISAVGIHTTVDLLSQTILDLAIRPEILEALRKEIAEVKQDNDNWLASTSALHNLRLLDSVLKETQRIKPVGGSTTQRRVQRTTTLPNGLTLPAQSTVLTSMSHMWSEQSYPSPWTWDGRRFLARRFGSDPKQARTAQLVTPSNEHLGFGQGIHCCPGRFFAATEIKVAMICILENFDFELVGDEKSAAPLLFGLGEFVSNPTARIRVRRRSVSAE